MFQPITNITIAHVPNNRDLIALSLERLGLLKPRKICVMPDFKRNKMFYTAYIEIAEWCDREVAYNLIQKIKDPRREARIVYDDDDWWAVEETAEEDLCYTQQGSKQSEAQGSTAFAHWTTKYNYEPKKRVRFNPEQLEDSIIIEELDLKIFKDLTEFNLDTFCVGFSLAYGFDFKAEFEEWSNSRTISEEALAIAAEF